MIVLQKYLVAIVCKLFFQNNKRQLNLFYRHRYGRKKCCFLATFLNDDILHRLGV